MLVDYDSLVNELSSVLSKCRLTAHRARVKALSTLLQGLLLLCEASLSGMGRGATLLDEQKTFSGQLKRAFRFLNNPQFDPWEVGNALFGHLTQGLKRVLIGVDWTQVGDFMILEATLVVAGRGIRATCVMRNQYKLGNIITGVIRTSAPRSTKLEWRYPRIYLQ